MEDKRRVGRQDKAFRGVEQKDQERTWRRRDLEFIKREQSG